MKLLTKNILLLTFIMLVGTISYADPPPPLDENCCLELEPVGGEPPSAEYLECIQMEANEPGSYCDPILPIDNNIYILATTVSGIVLACFVMSKKKKHKNISL